MSESADRLAFGAFETWTQAMSALVGCGRADVGSARVIFIALSSVFSEPGGWERTYELPFSESGEGVRCSSRFLAGQFGKGAPSRHRIGEALRAWLPARQAERIAGYISQRKIVIAVCLRKPEEERAVGLALLQSSAAPVEFHDLRPGGAAVN
jgi:hypothetical protein